MNRRMRAPPLALLLLAVLLALASSGAAYSHWSSTLSSQAAVETGNVEVEWTYFSCADKESSKDVGFVFGEIVDGQLFEMTINNAYPCYEADCQVEFTSFGTVPVIVEEIEFLPGQGLTGCTVQQSSSTGSFVATCDQMTVTWADGLGSQLHQGDFLGSSLRVHVVQEAEENSQYTFGVRVLLVQWNMSEL